MQFCQAGVQFSAALAPAVAQLSLPHTATDFSVLSKQIESGSRLASSAFDIPIDQVNETIEKLSLESVLSQVSCTQVGTSLFATTNTSSNLLSLALPFQAGSAVQSATKQIIIVFDVFPGNWHLNFLFTATIFLVIYGLFVLAPRQ